MAGLLERYRFAFLGAFTMFYFMGTALRARSSPLWHDEIYTILMSRLDLAHMWQAARQGVDPTPPLTDIVVRGFTALWGEGNIVSRLPAMIGFWVFCISLFAFVRRRLDIQYAFAAMLLPFSSGAYWYAIQARCYGLLLGFVGIALVSWQAAAAGRRRVLALPLLAIALALLLFSHFYAFLLLMPLCGAELWRAARSRRVDWPVWGALAAGSAAATALSFPLVAGSAHFRGHPFAIPSLHNLVSFYPDLLQSMITVLMGFLLLSSAWWVLGGGTARVSVRRIPDHELVAAVLLVMIPVAGLAVAELVTKMFTPRYFLSALAGVVLLVVFMTSVWSRGSAALGALLLIASGLSAARVIAHHLPYQEPVDNNPLLRQAIAQGPVVMDDGVTFLEQWYYLPEALKSRVSYVADPAFDYRWVGHDTVDVGMLGLRRWFGVTALDYAQVHRPGATFRIYHNSSGPAWLLQKLLEDGVRIELLASSGDRAVLRATVP